MKRRVVVTGMGTICPLGDNVDELWAALLDGKSGISGLTRFDASDYSSRIGGEVKDFDGSLYCEKKDLRRMDLTEQFAIAAAGQAISNSGLDLGSIDLDRAGVVIGSGIGGIATFEKQHEALMQGGHTRVSPFFIPMMIIDMCAGLVSIKYGLRGPNYATVSACSSGAHAISDAMRIIQRGEADVMVTGGAEAAITPVAMAGFCKARALSTRNDEPQRASRPFDKGRDGFVMSEGAAIMVLESAEHAKARKATILGEIKGAGMSGDAHHMTAPHPEGDGARRAMLMALKDSDLKPDQVSYINTHGTSTGLGDVAETKAIKKVFGQHAYDIPCNSTKSMVGHLLGAAGALEAIVALMSCRHNRIHPTINLEDPDPQCDLDYVPNQQREGDIKTAISNSFGFGGHNVTLVVGRVDDGL